MYHIARNTRFFIIFLSLAVLAGFGLQGVQEAAAVPLPGGTLDPTTIPKYVTPLVIPPVMNNTGTANAYEISVRQFQQQILPGGIWNTLNGRSDAFPSNHGMELRAGGRPDAHRRYSACG